MKNKYRVEPSTVQQNKRRFKSIKRLTIIPPALDAGGENDIAKALGIHEFVEVDLNWAWRILHKKFNTVTSFEVIEHLQNPLLYLSSVYAALSEGGRLYLTTPVKWFMGKGKYHFHEYTYEELLFLLQEAGFEVVIMERIQAYDLRHFGIRPIIRKIRDIIRGQCFLITAFKGPIL